MGLRGLGDWLRVRQAGAPRWFLGFLAVLATILGVVLATHH